MRSRITTAHWRMAAAATTLGLLIVLAACAQQPAQDPVQLDSGTTGVLVTETWTSAEHARENVDSVAYWPEKGWVLATAKATHRLLIYDAVSGALLTTVGSKGQAPGEFNRPNGIAVLDDLVLVVERDNTRVQVLRLPELEPLATFGEETLLRPYGVNVFRDRDGDIQVYVSDNYGPDPVSAPPANFYTRRIKHFRLSVDGDGFLATHVRSFGAATGIGILHTVESLVADPENGTLLVADEAEGAHNLKLYTLEGEFTGTTVGDGLFADEPEGVALYTCGPGGFWIVTDQRDAATYFHLLERTTFRHLGSFFGQATRNTDGVTLFQPADQSAGRVGFFAVDDDSAVSAFDLDRVAEALQLKVGCPL